MYDEESRIRQICRDAGMSDEQTGQVVDIAQEWADRRHEDAKEEMHEVWSE